MRIITSESTAEEIASHLGVTLDIDAGVQIADQTGILVMSVRSCNLDTGEFACAVKSRDINKLPYEGLLSEDGLTYSFRLKYFKVYCYKHEKLQCAVEFSF